MQHNVLAKHKSARDVVAKESPSTANGNKTIATTTTYLGGTVYESKTISPADPNKPNYTDKLLFTGQEEGRIRAFLRRHVSHIGKS